MLGSWCDTHKAEDFPFFVFDVFTSECREIAIFRLCRLAGL